MGSNIVPDRLPMSKVADYIYKSTATRVNQRAPYYWARLGMTRKSDGQKVMLKTEMVMGKKMTRKRWVDAFVSEFDNES